MMPAQHAKKVHVAYARSAPRLTMFRRNHSSSSSFARSGRRGFLKAVLSPALAAIVPARARGAEGEGSESAARLFFTSQGKTAIVNADGSGLRYFDFKVPGQATWQPGPCFADGRRVVFLSMEPRRDGPGRPFHEDYSQTPTHLWVHDLASGKLTEICNKNRLAPFITPALLLGEDRILVQVVRKNVGQLYSMRLDGTEAREFTRADEGMPYGLDLSPDGRRAS